MMSISSNIVAPTFAATRISALMAACCFDVRSRYDRSGPSPCTGTISPENYGLGQSQKSHTQEIPAICRIPSGQHLWKSKVSRYGHSSYRIMIVGTRHEEWVEDSVGIYDD